MGQVVTATLLLVTVGILVLRRYRLVRNRGRKITETRGGVITKEVVATQHRGPVDRNFVSATSSSTRPP